MTLNELKESIANSPNKDWFQAFTYTLKYPHLNYDVTFKGLASIYEFVLKQIEGFEGLESLPQEFVDLKNRFTETRQRIHNLIINNSIDEQNWINHLALLQASSPRIFLYDSPETEFLLNIHKNYPKHYVAAFEYLNGDSINSIHNKNYFIGYLLAYEFVSKDFSVLAERKNAEERSISTIRSNFQTRLAESETQLTEYLIQANNKYTDYSVKIDEFKTEKEAHYTKWFQNVSEINERFNINSNKRVKELEDLYTEKLKLEAPATYWRLRAKQLRTEGYWWLGGLVVCVGVTVGMLLWFLNGLSTKEFEGIFDNTAKSVKWSVALITLISFLAFAIRTFSKLTFSSFHLVRDAEEREQLTYIYLALQKEAKIDPTERHLIMQSLFSRADSGLLKDDASPTMPGNIVDQMIKR